MLTGKMAGENSDVISGGCWRHITLAQWVMLVSFSDICGLGDFPALLLSIGLVSSLRNKWVTYLLLILATEFQIMPIEYLKYTKYDTVPIHIQVFLRIWQKPISLSLPAKFLQISECLHFSDVTLFPSNAITDSIITLTKWQLLTGSVGLGYLGLRWVTSR